MRERQARNVSTFMPRLVEMMSKEPDLIRWDERGMIVIANPRQLERVLKNYFKTSQYASFQRQLSNFGFKQQRRRTSETVYVKVKGPPVHSVNELFKLQPLHILPQRHTPHVQREPPSFFCQNGFNPWTMESVTSFDNNDDRRPHLAPDRRVITPSQSFSSSSDSDVVSSSSGLHQSSEEQCTLGDVLIFREK